ncbi:DDE-type integrase/transposase/recombinase [Cupriavidus sp. BIS7]|uniref:DDE-type integrase/transposase/recombinase n=1 Tax=Cupriavidus sp. BIS7 TaxID=1217718 RepID=UPI0009FFA8E2|nr:DDE-type integrase/transposase/recombinase [Cupriavidus sp. BIS7]
MAMNILPQLVSGMLFRLRKGAERELHRIVWTGRQSNYTFTIPTSGSEWPEPHSTETFQLRFSSEYQGDDALEFILEDPSARKPQADPSAYALERMRWIAPLVEEDNLFEILVASKRGKKIAEQAAKVGVSVPTISFHTRRFLARGMTVSALEDDRYKCGGKGKKRNPTNKTGRKRIVRAGIGTPVNDSNREILEVAACYVLGGKKRTLQQGLDYINQHHCRDWEVTERFTIDQLRHHIESTRPFTKKIRKKLGERTFALKHRPFVGKTTAYGPGAEFQIDATIGDVYLVSAFDRTKIIGRPTIYIVSDTFSRLIVGISVSLSPPSIEGAALAMESVITPKVALCQEFGVEAYEDWWPSHHLPRTIRADHGSEFVSIRAWEKIVQRLLINVKNTKAFRPDWKSIVESRFNLLNAIWGDFVPGHVESDFNERGGPDYRLDSVLTLHEFTAVFLISVIEYNNRPLRMKSQIPKMVEAELSPTPVELWKFGTSEYSGILQTGSLDEMRSCVYPRARATVTEEGINFARRCYETPRAVREEWFARARHKNFETEIAYDPNNPSKMYVLYGDGSFEKASLRETGMQIDFGVSMSDIAQYRLAATKNLNNGFDKFEPLKMKLRDKADAIIEQASKKRTEAMEEQGIKRLSTDGIREARLDERALTDAIRHMASVGVEVAGHAGRIDAPTRASSREGALESVSVAALKALKKNRQNQNTKSS